MIFNDWNEFSLFDGENLVINGEFPSNLGNWVCDETKGRMFWQDGRLHLESIDYWARALQVVSVEAGKSYKFSGELDPGTNGGYIQLRDSNKQIIESMYEEPVSHSFIAPTSEIVIRLHAGFYKSGVCGFDNIKLIPA